MSSVYCVTYVSGLYPFVPSPSGRGEGKGEGSNIGRIKIDPRLSDSLQDAPKKTAIDSSAGLALLLSFYSVIAGKIARTGRTGLLACSRGRHPGGYGRN